MPQGMQRVKLKIFGLVVPSQAGKWGLNVGSKKVHG